VQFAELGARLQNRRFSVREVCSGARARRHQIELSIEYRYIRHWIDLSI
jgi:hypothetical protein